MKNNSQIKNWYEIMKIDLQTANCRQIHKKINSRIGNWREI